jgi:hypothetical protein
MMIALPRECADPRTETRDETGIAQRILDASIAFCAFLRDGLK